MRTLIILVCATSPLFTFSQNWNFLGSSEGIGNSSEIDIEISNNGELYAAFIDADNANRITVKRWSNQSWVTLGTAGIGNSNAFDIQLIMNGETPVVAAKFSGTVGSNTYDQLECFTFASNSWTPLGVGGTFRTDNSKDFAISSSASGNIFVTYYNQNSQLFPTGVINVKLNTVALIGNGDIAANSLSFQNSLGAVASDNGVYVALEEDLGLLSDGTINFSNVTSSTHTNSTVYNQSDADKIVFEKGYNSANYSLMHLTTSYNAKTLYYSAYNGTSFGTVISVASSTALTDFDFASQESSTYVFYRQGTTCYLKKISGDMNPSTTLSTISSDATWCPGSATSLALETYSGVHVIAYVDAGKCYVKEYNVAAEINSSVAASICEHTTWNNGGNTSVQITDRNFSHTNIQMVCTTQNPAVVPQSAISISFNGNNGYYLNISNTNDISTNTTVDLKWDLYENGALVATHYMPVTVYNTPVISIAFPNAEACVNGTPVSLEGKALPAGGTWTGTGVSGTSLNPGAFNPSPSTSTYLTYTKVSQQGCIGKDSVLFVVNAAPSLAITTVDADCNEANGTASVNISGGAPNYSGYWSNGSTSLNITDLEPGQYYFNATDANGCKSVGVASVGSTGIGLTVIIEDVVCSGNTSGEIDLSVDGTAAPYTYAWSNGATTQDLSNLAAGAYEVMVTDNEGCISTASYTVNQPAPLTLASVSSVAPECGTSTGALSVAFTGGTGALTYAWANAAGETEGNGTATADTLSSGSYQVTVTDAEGCTVTETVLLSDLNGPAILVDNITASDCSNTGSIDITDINGGSTFLWNTGQATADLSGIGAGTYILGTTGANGCTSYTSVVVPAVLPEFTEICLVTVDTNTNTNLIVWEKPVSSTIDHFNIYRETSQAGIYQLAGTVLYTEDAIFNDLVASPSVRSWRYKVSAVDGCGVESTISGHHKTVHLVINQGLGDTYNLIWDSYEGFSYTQFAIWRHTAVDDWVQIATMPTNLFTYTDTPPTENELEYLVTIDAPVLCSPEKAQDFNTTRSNKDKGALSGSGSLSVNEALPVTLSVSPNPTSDFFTVEISENGTNKTMQLVTVDGQVIQQIKLTSVTQTVDVSTLSSGLYFLKIEGQNNTVPVVKN